MNSILNCTKCPLYKNQPPLLDDKEQCDVMWIGLSAKKTELLTIDDYPLSPMTKSGQLIEQIESSFRDISTYKTNLVKCLPLDDKGKLRYPTNKEISICISHIKYEIEMLKPKIIIMLGQIVSDAISSYFDISIDRSLNFDYSYMKHNGVYFLSVQHPSYISVYKRKFVSSYQSAISRIVHELT